MGVLFVGPAGSIVWFRWRGVIYVILWFSCAPLSRTLKQRMASEGCFTHTMCRSRVRPVILWVDSLFLPQISHVVARHMLMLAVSEPRGSCNHFGPGALIPMEEVHAERGRVARGLRVFAPGAGVYSPLGAGAPRRTRAIRPRRAGGGLWGGGVVWMLLVVFAGVVALGECTCEQVLISKVIALRSHWGHSAVLSCALLCAVEAGCGWRDDGKRAARAGAWNRRGRHPG